MNNNSLNDRITQFFISMSPGPLSPEASKAYIEECHRYRKAARKYYSRRAFFRIFTPKPKFNNTWDSK